MYLNALEIRYDVLRRIDPRVRIIAGVPLILISVNVSNFIILGGIIVLCMLILCRDFVCIIKRLIPLEIFCVLFLIQSFFGLLETHKAFVYIMRVNCAALLYMLTIITMGIGVLGQALGQLRVSPKLISILYLTHRYIYLMSDKVFCSIKAMHLRKNPAARGLIFIWKAYAACIACAIVSSFVQAESVSAALMSRGFDGVIPQTGARKWKK